MRPRARLAPTRSAPTSRPLAELIEAHYHADRRVLDHGAAGVSRAFRRLRGAVTRLAAIAPATLGPQAERVAVWLNVDNALTVHAAIARRITSSVRGSGDFFEGPHDWVGGREVNLND